MLIENVIKKGNFVSLTFDDKSQIKIHIEIYLKAAISEGDSITKEKILSLQKEETLRKIKFTALYYLGRRAHSRKELEEKLKKKEYPFEEINISLDRLAELGYINDFNFAELYFEEKLFKKKKGNQKIIAELYKKGISRSIIDAVSKKYSTDDIHFENALYFANKKIKFLGPKNLEPFKKKQKVFAHLISKGFNIDTINRVMAQIDFS